MHKERIGIIVLAAGASTRMGRPKQLIKISDVSLIRRAAQTAAECGCGAVAVVLGANAELVRPELEELDVLIAINTEWSSGMASSIRSGLNTLLAIAPEAEGVLVMCADQPRVSSESLDRILEAELATGLVAARYNETIGAPAFFSRKYFNELLSLNGECGAKSLLMRYQDQVVPVEIPEAAHDVDTPEDVAEVSQYFRSSPAELIADEASEDFESPTLESLWPRQNRRQFIANVTVAGAGIVVAPALFQSANAAETARVENQSPPGANTVPVKLRVNGTEHALNLDPRVTLLDVLRERLGLTGSKKGCDHGQCGACTVLVDGRRINSCLALAVVHEGDEITTIEGLAKEEELHPVQAAFLEHDGFQCGYCTPGQICSAVALLKEGHANDDGEIREWMSGNICRCGAYLNIVAAIREAKAKTAGTI